MMLRRLSVTAGIAVVIACGAIQGLWTNRWSAAAEAAAGRLASIPSRVGDWDGEDVPLDAQVWEVVGGTGYLNRRYVNRRTGQVVAVYLACGRPGPIAIHTPDLCYPRSGYLVIGENTRRTVAVDGPAHVAEFNRMVVRDGLTKDPILASVRQEVLWGWSATGQWEAPRAPRVVYARYPVLYKLYVVHPLPGDKETAGDDADEFIRLLLREVQKSVFDNP
jgi:hypothetical protein